MKQGEIWIRGARPWRPRGWVKWLSSWRSGFDPVRQLIAANLEGSGSMLDLGCGEDARGSVNVDVYLPSKRPVQFVMASAEDLPFKDGSFRVTLSRYVIEHCLNPPRMIREQVRCARDRAIIITDNSEWIGDALFRVVGTGRIFHDEHCYRWTVEYLRNLVERSGYGCTVNASNLSPTVAVRILAKAGGLPRIGRFFLRDIVCVISKGRGIARPEPGPLRSKG